MNLLQDIQKLVIKKKTPKIKPGFTVRVHQKIKEGNKERIQIFEGIVLAVNSGHGADKTFTVRKVVGGIGVEKIFPLYSTNIEKIEIKKTSKIRRAKLYYLRSRFGKSAKMKEEFVSDEKLAGMYENAPVLEENNETKADTGEKAKADEAETEADTEEKAKADEAETAAGTEEKAKADEAETAAGTGAGGKAEADEPETSTGTDAKAEVKPEADAEPNTEKPAGEPDDKPKEQ